MFGLKRYGALRVSFWSEVSQCLGSRVSSQLKNVRRWVISFASPYQESAVKAAAGILVKQTDLALEKKSCHLTKTGEVLQNAMVLANARIV